MSSEELLVSLLAEATGDKELGNQLYTGEGDEKSLISNTEAKKLVKEKLKTKFENLGTITDAKKEEIERAAKKAVYEKIEGDIKTTYGIEVQIQKDGTKGLADHLKDQFKNEKIDPQDATKSEAYIKLKKELGEERKMRAKDKQEFDHLRVMDQVHFGMPSLLDSEELNFVKPTNEAVLRNNLQTAKQKLNKEGVNYRWNDDKTNVIVTDKNGNPLTDGSGNEMSVRDYQIQALKETFDVKANTQRGSAATGDQGRQFQKGTGSSSSRSSTFRNSEGQDQTFNLPADVKTKQDGRNWYAGNIASFNSIEERDAAEKLVEELPESA